MGADWYYCLTFYGYRIFVPDGITYKKFVNQVNEINEFLQEPYKITGLLESFHSRMESMSEWEQESFDSSAVILIGFKPDNKLEDFTHNVNELKEYVTDNHYLMGLELDESPKFYSGIEWFTNMYYEYDSSDDDDEDEDDEDEDEEEEEEEDDDDDITSSDEDETKIAPAPYK
jgi:hypothetical protein